MEMTRDELRRTPWTLEATLTSETDTIQQSALPSESAVDILERLEGENVQLKQAVRSHAVIDQAIGVIVALGQLTPDQGWDALRGISQNTNIKLRHVAELIVAWARTGELSPEIHSQLAHQLGLGNSHKAGRSSSP